jgi:hypothetical protein
LNQTKDVGINFTVVLPDQETNGGKITALKLGHPVFDGGIRWYLFP